MIKCWNSLNLDQLDYKGLEGVIMLGKTYDKRSEFTKDYLRLIYFSYRSGLKDRITQKGREALSQDTSKF